VTLTAQQFGHTICNDFLFYGDSLIPLVTSIKEKNQF